MQVSVFYSANSRSVLVMPAAERLELPEPVKDRAWAQMADTTLGDQLLRHAAPIIEAEISAYGYSVLPMVTEKAKPNRLPWFWSRRKPKL